MAASISPETKPHHPIQRLTILGQFRKFRDKWRFPIHGVPWKNHPFYFRMFHDKPCILGSPECSREHSEALEPLVAVFHPRAEPRFFSGTYEILRAMAMAFLLVDLAGNILNPLLLWFFMLNILQIQDSSR